MDVKRDIRDICETLRADELYTEAMAIEEITKAQDARIKELEEENERLDAECTKRQLEIYRLQKVLKKISIDPGHNGIAHLWEMAAEAIGGGGDDTRKKEMD